MASRHETLKARQRLERDDYPEDLILRVHRDLSWLDRAEQEFRPGQPFRLPVDLLQCGLR